MSADKVATVCFLGNPTCVSYDNITSTLPLKPSSARVVSKSAYSFLIYVTGEDDELVIPTVVVSAREAVPIPNDDNKLEPLASVT